MAVCEAEILGVQNITLYENEGVTITRPDIAIEDVVYVQTTGTTIAVPNSANPKWSQEIQYSGNFKQLFSDNFTFNLQGLDDATQAELYELIDKRVGFLVELKTNNNERFLFQTPVFVAKDYDKKENSNVWELLLRYRVPTLLEYLNVVDFIQNYYYYTQLDGVNEYITITSDLSIQLDRSDSFTISQWVQPASIGVGMDIFSKYDGSQGYRFAINSSGGLSFILRNSAIFQMNVRTVELLTAGVMYNVAVTYDGTSLASGFNFYINGILKSKTVITDNSSGGTSTVADLSIGSLPSSGLYFDGYIDEVSFFKGSAHNATTMLDIYNRGRENPHLGDIANLVSHWRMDAINPIDEVAGVNNGTGVNIDASNIIQWN